MANRFKWILLGSVIVIVMLLSLRAAVLEIAGSAGEATGTILVWHDWSENEAAALQEVIEKFRELNPQSQVLTVAVEPDQLLERFTEAAETGFGPDLLIGPSSWVPTLAEAGLIYPLGDTVDAAYLQRFLAASVEQMRYQDRLYGLPESVRVPGLYFNRTAVEMPPATLDELLAAAQAGAEVGINTSFEMAFWGIRAFGGRLFDKEGRAILDQGGFANWLNWLKSAQELPTVVLSTNQETLRVLFGEGELSYLVDGSAALVALREALGAETLGVVPLPGGPTGPAAPLLEVEGLMFSSVSSLHQRELAMRLARFITNNEQQTTLMRKAHHVPANSRVKVNPRLYPDVSAFAAQARTAVPITQTGRFETAVRLGNEAYAGVLEGVLTPAEAAVQTTALINESNGFPATQQVEYQCEGVGTLILWYDRNAVTPENVATLSERFSRACPNIVVSGEGMTVGEMAARLENGEAAGERADLLLLANPELPVLVQLGLLTELGPHAEPELLQRFVPLALAGMRHAGGLYGLPFSIDSQALVYDPNRVEVPPATLNDLLLETREGRAVGLTSDFVDAYWGYPAYGGRILDAQGQITLDPDRLARWLAWHQDAAAAGAPIVGSTAELLPRFAAGEITYLVARLDDLAALGREVGEGRLAVVSLPDGPEESAGGLAMVNGFALGAGLDPQRIDLALEFVGYATRADVQSGLLQTHLYLPANANVDVDDSGPLAAFREGLKVAELYPNLPEMDKVVELGSDAFVWVSAGVLDAEEAAQETASLVNEATGLVVAEETVTCAGRGAIRLWHSWLDGPSTRALESIAESFSALCPQLDIELVPFEPEQLREALLSASDAEENDLSPPDAILGSSDWLPSLVDAERIASLAGQVDSGLIRRLLPAAVETVTLEGEILGLPVSVETMALYVNEQRAPVPASTLDELLGEAVAGRRVSLLVDGYHAFWGIGAFSVSDAADAAAPTAQPRQPEVPDAQDLEGWLAWLQSAGETPGVLLEQDADRAEALFANGRLAYHTGSSDQLAALQSALGPESLAVVPLPAGPAGPGRPLLSSQALFLPRGQAEERRQAALSFLRYLAGSEGQTRLMEMASRIPANRVVDTRGFPAVAGFVAQAGQAVVPPANWPFSPPWIVSGDRYAQLLAEEITPAEAAARILAEARKE